VVVDQLFCSTALLELNTASVIRYWSAVTVCPLTGVAVTGRFVIVVRWFGRLGLPALRETVLLLEFQTKVLGG
jgi:hypothetical protein